MIKPYPCKNCKDRHLGCHDKCERYLEAKRANSVNIFEDKASIIEYEREQKSKSIRKRLNRPKNYGGWGK